MSQYAPAILRILGVPVYLGDILVWGGLATILMTLVMEVSRWLGLSRMGVPFMLGTIFTADRRKASVIGLFVHGVNGWLLAIVYAMAFQRLETVSWWLGMSFGLVQALFMLVVLMPMLPAVHPRMASERHGPSAHRALEPPGFFALNYGSRTPLVALVAHLIYGAILGGAFEIVVTNGA